MGKKRKKTQAEYLLEELRVIPKLIEQLKRDIEITRGSLLTSPQWSDVKVSGCIKRSQEDKNIAIIDVSDYNIAKIEKLLKRKQEIVDTVMEIPDMVQRHVLITTYLNCETTKEARIVLCIGKDKYNNIKQEAIESLDSILEKSLKSDDKRLF